MPGYRDVAVVKRAVAGHVRLARAALLTGAAVYAHGAFIALLLHYVAQHQPGGDCAHAQQVMSAALTHVHTGLGSLSGAVGLLAQAIERVKFAQQRYDRLAAAPGRHVTGLGIGYVFGDVKAHFSQIVHLRPAAFELAESGFGVAPGLVYQLAERLCVIVHLIVPP